MRSLLQDIQQALGKTASRITAPSILELPVTQIPEPTIGWLPEDCYSLHLAQTRAVSLASIASPSQISLALLAVPLTRAVELGQPARTGETPADKWRFHGRVEHSSLALLTETETEELRAKLGSSAGPNRIRRLINPPGISENLHRKLTRSSPLRTEDCLALLMARCVVSDDLHKPLARHARADGKRYADKAQTPDKTPGVDKLQTPELAFVGEGLGNRKAFEQERGRVTRGMSVWDLLLPLLQRPVNLDFGTVVDLPSNLYPYQTKGVEFLLETPSALLGDDMGTGKTVQTSVALRMLFQTGKIRTALIVCPLSVIPNWDRELAKWAGNLAVTAVRGDKEHRKICWRQAAHIWLVTYDTLRNDTDNVLISRKGGFDLVVLDEAQRVKNWSAGITRAVRSLRATYRWGLTGTPLENNTDELWTILNVLKPELSELQRAGLLDWSGGIRSVLRPMFLRRRKQDVLTDLPPLVKKDQWLALDDEQRKSYDELEQRGVLELHAKGETITAQIIIVLLNKLKQVCNRCPRTGASSKIVWLRERLETVVAEGDKALIFSQYTDERFAGADWLEKELAGFGALNYSNATSDKQRKALLAAFKEKPEHKVFVGHPKTAGLGLNELVVANYVVHFDHWWNPAVMNQATARAHRPGQTKTVFAYDLWVQDTYEEIISKRLEQKQGLYNEVVDSMSVERKPEDNLAFAVADTLFAKYGLKPIQRKPVEQTGAK